MHYYQRWAENDRARVSALKAMANVIEQKLEGLSELTATPTSQLKFLPDAWAQVRGGYFQLLACGEPSSAPVCMLDILKAHTLNVGSHCHAHPGSLNFCQTPGHSWGTQSQNVSLCIAHCIIVCLSSSCVCLHLSQF